MAIFLVRHGETDANAARIIQKPDAPLSQRGRDQAARLARRLASLGVAAIVSSDFPRAQVTAEHIRAATGAPLELWPDLRERNMGLLRGRAYADIDFDIFAPDYAPPDGETWEEFDARVARAWTMVIERALGTDGNLAVITHGLVCHSIVNRVNPGASVVPGWTRNASLTIVSGSDRHTIDLLGCTEHLADLARARPSGPA
jgi:2,3-bisphosphoglycerate-dependent phosphoglycerate mutase